jgi:hypothetical protein
MRTPAQASKTAPRVVIMHRIERSSASSPASAIGDARWRSTRSIASCWTTSWVARLRRRMVFALAVTDRHLYVTLGDTTLSGVVTRFDLSPPREAVTGCRSV